MSKGKDTFRENTKDAFAFLSVFRSIRPFPSGKEKGRLRVIPLKDALAFTADIIHPGICGCQAAIFIFSDMRPSAL